jgi:hypothetical protein
MSLDMDKFKLKRERAHSISYDYFTEKLPAWVDGGPVGQQAFQRSNRLNLFLSRILKKLPLGAKTGFEGVSHKLISPTRRISRRASRFARLT